MHPETWTLRADEGDCSEHFCPNKNGLHWTQKEVVLFPPQKNWKSLGQKKCPTRPTNHLVFLEGTNAMIDLCKSPIEKRFVKKSKLHSRVLRWNR